MIVEDEQKGKECAAYASETLKNLGMYLTEREEVKSITHNVNIYLQSLHFYLQSKFLEPKNIKVDSLNQF
jgi:hypothetical protein